MDVRKGFKQTEIGNLPDEWDVVTLEKVSQILDPQPDHRTPPSVFGGEPYIGISDFIDDKTVNWDTTRKIISKAVDKQQASFRIESGDIIFGKIGTIGQPKFVPVVPFRYALSANVLLIKPTIKPYFLMSWLQSSTCQTAINRELHSTSQAAFGINKMRQVLIPVPPLAEQEAIAEALSDADALIESLETLVAKKRQVKQGAMSELLSGKKRLPEFSGEWKRKNIKTIVQTPVTDGPHLTPVFLEDGIPFLSVNNIVDNVIDWSDLRYISLEDHQIFSKKCKPQRNDILLGKAASVGKVAIVETEREFNIWSPIAMIRVSKEYNPKYVYYALQTRDISRQIEVLTNSSSQGNIGMGEIEKIEIPLPSKEEQTAIAEILSDMDAEIRELEGKLSKARAVKAGMMSALLTGRVRLLK